MAHSFPSMWSFFLLHSASCCHSPLSLPWSLCFSTMLSLPACSSLAERIAIPNLPITDPKCLSSPRPLFIPLSSLGLWLTASLLNLVLSETPVLVPPGSSAACHYPA